jgi:hypothetical protein
LNLLEFSSGRTAAIATAGLRPATSFGGVLGVGPGDRWILMAALVRSDHRIILVENFR